MITEALNKLRPGAIFSVSGETYEGISWLDTVQTKPTFEEVSSVIAVIKAEKDRSAFNAPILAQIKILDEKRIRPLAEGDTTYLSNLNSQIQALREQLL